MPLDLQALVQQCYRNGGYEGTLDYTADPEPPMLGAEGEWAEAWLKEKGFRTPAKKRPGREAAAASSPSSGRPGGRAYHTCSLHAPDPERSLVPLVVQKFGGTSVANAERIMAAARRAIRPTRPATRSSSSSAPAATRPTS